MTPQPLLAAAYEHNGRPMTSHDFYALACDPQRSLAVEACAGAGKTWLLVSRIVRALLEGMDPVTGELSLQPQEILAITFTRRAAAEMRRRLYELLAEFAAGDRAARVLALQQRGLLNGPGEAAASRLPEHLAGLYRQVLSTGRQVQVRTFHGWFAALLRNAPLAVLESLQLPARYELLEDDSRAVAQVWRRFHAALLAEPQTGSGLEQDYESLVFEYGRSQTIRALEAALDKRAEFELADQLGVVDASVRRFDDQFTQFMGLTQPEDFLFVQPNQQRLADAARALGQAGARTHSDAGLSLEIALSARDADAVIAALMTKKEEPRKFSEAIIGIGQVRAAQDLVGLVLAARHQHQAWRYQTRLARLSRLLLREFAELKRERGWVDMGDVERAARLMLGHPVLSGWVQERLDARIRHVLIDEFQDTSPLQWQALSAWLSAYAGAGSRAPSVFIVGDPKQSIYRFRRAEPQVFRAAQQFIRSTLGGDLLSCDHTRRNAPTVMGVVNAVLGAARDADGYSGFRTHTTASVEAGAVLCLPAIGRPGRASQVGEAALAVEGWRDSLTQPRQSAEETLLAQEAAQTARWIAQQLRGGEAGRAIEPAGIMVLSRRRAGLLPLHRALAALGIDAQIGEKTELIDCCEVQDLVALVDVLVSPGHNLSLARVLKSPLFGVADETLIQLALAQRDDSGNWIDLLLKKELKSQDGRGLHQVLMRWKAWFDTWPPHDALQAVYDDGDVLARFAAAAPPKRRDAVLINLQSLLAASLALNGGRYATPYALVRALKAGGVHAPAAVSTKAVQLLTIHGAKGLEAQTVVLLDTDTADRNAETMSVLIDWPGEAAGPRRFIFLASESRPPTCAVATLEAERTERRREELNALYVALTRARQTLVISRIEPYRAAPASWWQRLKDQVSETAAPEAVSLPFALASLPNFQMQDLPPAQAGIESRAITFDDGLALDQDSAERPDKSPGWEPTEVLDASARRGLAMHRLLQWHRLDGISVAAAAREFDLDPAQAAEAAAMAQAILQGEGAWAWDSAVVAWAADELELIHRGQVIRLDRLVQRRDAGHQGHWWVLDYKSASAPQRQPALCSQLEAYRRAVQAVYPSAVVHAAFLTAQGAMIIPDNPNSD